MQLALVIARWIGLPAAAIGLLLGIFLLGFWTGSAPAKTPGAMQHSMGTAAAHSHEPAPGSVPGPGKPEASPPAGSGPMVWTCSMHPQIRQDRPGACPICGMDLVPATDEHGEPSPRGMRGTGVASKETGTTDRAAVHADGTDPPGPNAPRGPEARARKYACSMFCVPPLPEPGKCPVCGMDMVEVTDDTNGVDGSGPPRLSVSAHARALAEIRTTPAVRRYVAADVRLAGKVEVDETRRKTITAWVPGRIDRLFVDYTGVRVNQGDTMVKLFSPELIAAQEELIQGLKTAKEMEKSGLAGMRQNTRATVEAARARLRNLGLAADQVAAVERAGRPSDHVEIRAPQGGTVIRKNALEGQYVRTGTPIYTIADLSEVWVVLDAYESDLVWIRYGQKVSFETVAYPGEVFQGRIAFIDPVLDDRTRTVKVRVNVPDPDGKLKPSMLVRAQVHSRIAGDGKVMDPELAGKWISPRHPEIVKDGPGTCDRCGIALVQAEDLGYVALDPARHPPPLVIPASAPLITGRRAVVYVETEPGVFEGREIVLGPRAGDTYLVRAGLREGEQVVVHGAFKIDSAMQIRARPSMMNPATDPASADERGATGVNESHPVVKTSKPSAPPRAPAGKPQTLCPVMGKPIVKHVFTDHEGKRVYFCCPPCIRKFEADPDTYLDQLRQDGVVLEPAPGPTTPPAGKPQTHCPVMGKPIVKQVFTDHEGKRIYFCCPPCIRKFEADPDTYLDKLRQDGVVLENTPVK